jgi:shikimate kinase
VIYLRARPEDLYERVRHDRNRPLLATADPLRRLRELYAQRDPLYKECSHIICDTGSQSVQSLTRHLLASLEAQWKVSA